jgi:hypothetical protein
MRKVFTVFLLIMIPTFALTGCGGSGGTSADPLGTDTITFGHKNDQAGNDWSMAMTVAPFQTVVLTAKVKNASDKEVSDREVTFGYVSKPSGSSLSHANLNTSAAGEATIIYTAGPVAGLDVVQARISNGAFGNVNITVSTEPVTGNRITLTVDPETNYTTPLPTTSSNCTLTALVKQEDGITPVADEPVTFSIVGGGLGSFVAPVMPPPIIVYTGGDGLATVVFQGPGGAGPGETVVTATINGVVNDTVAARIIYW